jgi:hypothetical protein
MVAAGSVDQGVFALYARHLLAHGLAVLPISVDEKEPLVRGWRKWRGPPSIKVVDKFARQFPEANVAILPGQACS